MDKRSVIAGLANFFLIIMDNDSYNSVREDGKKAPTSNTWKGGMISWLKVNKIPFNENNKKPELYEIIKSKKPAPVYKIDEYFQKQGHDVLGLLPYHCEFNRIELIWVI
jgi:hypothetical protein